MTLCVNGILFISQLCHEDTDIHDPACKCLSLLVQLFGGEQKEALNPENMVGVCLSVCPSDCQTVFYMSFPLEKYILTKRFSPLINAV